MRPVPTDKGAKEKFSKIRKAGATARFPAEIQWRRSGSNRQPPACKAGALPIELRPPTNQILPTELQMGAPEFESGTSSLSATRSNQLSYAPLVTPIVRGETEHSKI